MAGSVSRVFFLLFCSGLIICHRTASIQESAAESGAALMVMLCLWNGADIYRAIQWFMERSVAELDSCDGEVDVVLRN